jgi:hypothetical protein
VAIGPQLGVGDQSTGIMLQGVAPESRLGPIDPDRRGSACHERNDLGCEPLQALDALRDGLAPKVFLTEPWANVIFFHMLCADAANT